VTETIPTDALPLIDGRNFAHVATIMPNGAPQVSPVWITRDGEQALVFNTAYGRTKARNIERNPQVAISVHDQDNPYTYLQVRGRAELVDDGADEVIDELSRKYLGKDYPFRTPEEQRVTVRVTVESVDFHPPRG
jgi:PPOX class probable F420-dependent enzyme